jgi:hypothetical protein
MLLLDALRPAAFAVYFVDKPIRGAYVSDLKRRSRLRTPQRPDQKKNAPVDIAVTIGEKPSLLNVERRLSPTARPLWQFPDGEPIHVVGCPDSPLLTLPGVPSIPQLSITTPGLLKKKEIWRKV